MSGKFSDEIDALARKMETIIESNDEVLGEVGEFKFEEPTGVPVSQGPPDDVDVEELFS